MDIGWRLISIEIMSLYFGVIQQGKSPLYFYNQGAGGDNWNIIIGGANHTLVKQVDHLELKRTDSGGGTATLEIQAIADVQSVPDGLTGYLTYQVVSAGGTIQTITDRLTTSGGTGDTDGEIVLNNEPVGGEETASSATTTDGATAHSPRIQIVSVSILYTIKIIAVYYE